MPVLSRRRSKQRRLRHNSNEGTSIRRREEEESLIRTELQPVEPLLYPHDGQYLTTAIIMRI